jgi:hypothetical protein
VKDLFLGGLLIATGLAMIAVLIGAIAWILSFGVSVFVAVLDSGFEHGFALATNIFGG